MDVSPVASTAAWNFAINPATAGTNCTLANANKDITFEDPTGAFGDTVIPFWQYVYWEVELRSTNRPMVGIAKMGTAQGGLPMKLEDLPNQAGAWVWEPRAATFWADGVSRSFGPVCGANDVVGILVDLRSVRFGCVFSPVQSIVSDGVVRLLAGHDDGLSQRCLYQHCEERPRYG